MIEEVLLNYLNNALTVPAFMEVPEQSPSAFVVIEKTGSSEENYIYSSIFTIQSYGKTLYYAAKLNDDVRHAMAKAIQLPEICRVELNSDYNYTDTQTKKYRYQAVFDIVHY